MYTQNFVIEIRRKTFYVVKDVQNEERIKIETHIIEEIAKLSDERKDAIAVLLAQIESIKISTHFVKKDDLVIEEGCLIHSLQEILFQYSAETLTDVFEDMKYFEIKQILESEYPVIELKRNL